MVIGMTNLDGHLDFGSVRVDALLDRGPVGHVWGSTEITRDGGLTEFSRGSVQYYGYDRY